METATHGFDLARFVLGHRPGPDGRTGDEVEWVFAHLSTGVGGSARAATVYDILRSQSAVPTDRDCGLVLGERGTVVLGLSGEVQAVARFYNRPVADRRYDGIDVIGTEGSIALRGTIANQLFQRRGHTWAEHDPWQPVPVAAQMTSSANEVIHHSAGGHRGGPRARFKRARWPGRTRDDHGSLSLTPPLPPHHVAPGGTPPPTRVVARGGGLDRMM
jgi:predicted dehydrogenase